MLRILIKSLKTQDISLSAFWSKIFMDVVACFILETKNCSKIAKWRNKLFQLMITLKRQKTDWTVPRFLQESRRCQNVRIVCSQRTRYLRSRQRLHLRDRKFHWLRNCFSSFSAKFSQWSLRNYSWWMCILVNNHSSWMSPMSHHSKY